MSRRTVDADKQQQEFDMRHTKLSFAAACAAVLLSASAVPAFAQSTETTTTPHPSVNTTGREPEPMNTARGAENGPQSTTIQGGPAGALGSSNSGVTSVPGAAPSGGTMHSGG